MAAPIRARDRRLEIRTTAEERALIDRAAQASGTDLTSFVVTHLADAARIVLADRDHFVLDTDAAAEWDRINDAPARDLPGLRRPLRTPVTVHRMKYPPPRLLSPGHHLDNFTCASTEQTTWLRRHAHQSATTRVLVVTPTDRDEVIAYYAWTMASLDLHHTPQRPRKDAGRYPQPVALLARLGVHTDHERQGLGAALLTLLRKDARNPLGPDRLPCRISTESPPRGSERHPPADHQRVVRHRAERPFGECVQ